MDRDTDHLNTLAVLHYVVAGLATLASLFPTVHLLVGIGLVSGAFTDPGEPFPYPLIGWFFIIFASCWILLGLVFSSCLALAGRSLQQKRRYQFCLVMAGLACMFMPFGTVLGVFTIVTLMKGGVKDQFQRAPAPEPP
jgi:hypothetical protein